jgi:hypothetical protein
LKCQKSRSDPPKDLFKAIGEMIVGATGAVDEITAGIISS